MNYLWSKHYKDGNVYTSENGKGSWRNSPLDNISAADLIVEGFVASIVGDGEYWQSETYESLVGANNSSVMTAIRIEKKIEKGDSFRIDSTLGDQPFRVLSEDFIGKWFIAEFDFKASSIRTYLSDRKI